MAYEKSPDYEQRSAEIAEKVKREQDESLSVVRDLLSKEAANSLKTILSLRDTSADERIVIDAAKHLLKLCGLEVTKTELSGKVNFEPVILSRTTD